MTPSEQLKSTLTTIRLAIIAAMAGLAYWDSELTVLLEKSGGVIPQEGADKSMHDTCIGERDKWQKELDAQKKLLEKVMKKNTGKEGKDGILGVIDDIRKFIKEYEYLVEKLPEPLKSVALVILKAAKETLAMIEEICKAIFGDALTVQPKSEEVKYFPGSVANKK